jgi:poly(A) polymerase
VTIQNFDKAFPWLGDPFIKRLVEILGIDAIRFVGGAVRDSIIDKPIHDIDAATPLLPETVMSKLSQAGISVIPTGLKHGTITAHSKDLDVEITTLRVDAQTDGRHAHVVYTDDWMLDALRRDFSINAIYVDAKGDLFDPCGGVADLKQGTVRFIGNPYMRIEEDALRILRFFRFFAWYGVGNIDQSGYEACCKSLTRLEKLSIERIRDEFLKLLKAPKPYKALERMSVSRIISEIMPDSTHVEHIDYLKSLQSLATRETAMQLGIMPWRRFICFYGADYAGYAQIGKALKLSKAQIRHLTQIYKANEFLKEKTKYSAINDTLLKALIYRFGFDIFEHLVPISSELFTFVSENSSALKDLKNWPVPICPVKGRDLIKEGYKPGPELAQILKNIETTWINSDFMLKKADLILNNTTLKNL